MREAGGVVGQHTDRCISISTGDHANHNDYIAYAKQGHMQEFLKGISITAT